MCQSAAIRQGTVSKTSGALLESDSAGGLQLLIVRRRRDVRLPLTSISPCTATSRGPFTAYRRRRVCQVCVACAGKLSGIRGPNNFNGTWCVTFHGTVLLSSIFSNATSPLTSLSPGEFK
jgi:hypothetical protein